MKSRKAQKRSSLQSRQANLRKALARQRFGSLEKLEDRQMMAADTKPWTDGLYYPQIGLATAWLPRQLSYQTYAARSAAAAGGSSGGNTLSGEGAGTIQSVSETEPNNRSQDAQFLNLGNLPSNVSGVNFLGSLPAPVLGRPVYDEDWVAFDLKAGDVLDAKLSSLSGGFQVSFIDSTGKELAGNDQAIAFGYPNISPLSMVRSPSTGQGEVDMAIVVPKDGRYYARVSDGVGNYTLALRTYRSPLEATPVGTKQKLFLDFDGATMRGEIVGSVGTRRLSPLSSFLQGWNLSAADENALIDKIIASVKKAFTAPDALPAMGNNGYYTGTGVAGDFDIEFLNSRDNPDSFGDPNVSRVIVGGTVTELGISTIGIAQSIDVGNFDTQETAVVLLDNIVSNFLGFLPRAGNVSALDLIGDSIGRVVAHEAGHFFGSWHTDNTNNNPQIMDTGGTPGNLMGVGLDGIYGTADDVPVRFGTDTYDAFAGLISFGVEDTGAATAAGLSTGTQGGSINGYVYQDNNSNRAFDSTDTALSGYSVFADTNLNGSLDATEPRAFSRADGSYTLSVAPGTYTIRQQAVSGYTVVAPTSGSYSVSVAANQSLTGYNFGDVSINRNITGYKWNDLNGNGLVDAGEPRLSGVWIFIDLDGDKRIDIGEPSTQTAADGSYTLKFPANGTYQIREVIDPGFVQSYPGPSKDYAHTVTITGNTAADLAATTGLNFGNRLYLDLGDAPASYGTLRANNGAAHGYDSRLTLGANWDAESDGQPSTGANGDDNSGLTDTNGSVIDDEDGLTLTRPLVRGRTDNQVAVTVVNTTGATAYVQAFIDYNIDGDFLDAGEQVATNVAVAASGTTLVTFSAPSGAKLGSTYARVRLSSTPNVGATGLAKDGEVEDYAVTIVDSLQIAVNDAFSVSRNSTLNSLDVVANDFTIPGQPLTIVTAGPSRVGGIVQISGNGTVLYTPPTGFVGSDSFPYTVQSPAGDLSTAQVTVTVNLAFADPIAIDDSFDVATNAISYPLNVLANDIEGNSGALSIISVTQPSKGGAISIATGGQSLRYTPPRNLGDTEQFTYTVADPSGKTSTATVTLHTLPGDQSNDDVLIKLVATDLNGNAISAIPQGQDFRIDVLVDDLRNDRSQFVTSPGVYSAFFDMLYNLQLVTTAARPTGAVSPSDRFDFDVTFYNSYVNGTSGDASIPGLIDDFGAFSSNSTLSFPDPVKFASLRFTARSPGIATFLADPADTPPSTDVTLFDTPSTAVPIEKVRYIGTSIEIVGDSVEFPQAVDDSFTSNVPAGALSYPLAVMANDLPGSTGVIRLSSTTQPANGNVVINNNGTPNNTLDDRILYTPNSGFQGTDQFVYTITDSRGIQSSAKVTVRVGTTDTNDEVALDLVLFKADGTQLADGETLKVGDQFQLRGYVQDIRSAFGSNRGAFAAYEDVIYPASLVSTIADTNNPLGFNVAFGPNYTRVQSGDARTKGLINEIGAVQIDNNGQSLGSSKFLLFTVTLTATKAGLATFVSDPADISPLHDTLTYEPPAAVAIDKIRYGFDSVTIVANGNGGSGEYTNPNNRFDVNNDGFVSPIDALIGINALNSGKGGSLGGTGGSGEGEGTLYYDVNGDGNLSALDVLLIVNHLNNGGGSGEGEGAELLNAILAGNAVSSSSNDGDACSPVVVSPETFATAASSAGAAIVYGPKLQFSDAVDDLLGSTSEGEDAGFDDLLSSLAPDINDTWKRSRSL
ncbi:MAG: Ig-like domain-containing protein [Pirellulales bacterium]